MLIDITSSTLISLTTAEVLGILVFMTSTVVGVAAFVRKDERDKARLDQLEKGHSTHDGYLKHLTEQIDRLTGVVNTIAKQRSPRPAKTIKTP